MKVDDGGWRDRATLTNDMEFYSISNQKFLDLFLDHRYKRILIRDPGPEVAESYVLVFTFTVLQLYNFKHTDFELNKCIETISEVPRLCNI